MRENKTGFLPSCHCVDTTVRMHYMDMKKAQGKKTRWELHKNATCYFEILKATPKKKTTAVRSLTSHPKKPM